MKVLIFGPSGSGKTYLSSQLKNLGINSADADLIDGLSSWFDGKGNKVKYPVDADQEFLDNHEFLWDRDFLKSYLNQNSNIYLFGVAGNFSDMLDLFDRVYFLKAPPEVIMDRLTHESRENPMGQTEYQRQNAVNWGLQLEQKAKDLKIPFLDATLKPEEILKQIETD